MSERGIKSDEAAAAFRVGIPYVQRKLITSDKWIAGINAGGIYFGDISEVRMPIRESIASSRLGQFIATARRRLASGS